MEFMEENTKLTGDKKMNTLIIGAGGIGSWLVDDIYRQIKDKQIPFDADFTIADDDIVELHQIKPVQNFEVKDAGLNKALALEKRYEIFGARTIRIEKPEQLKGYNFYILAVDNDKVRKLVIEYCFKHNKEFIDSRATGRNVFVTPKLKILEENMKFVNINDDKNYSCQDEGDLKRGFRQIGNEIAAKITCQMILNHFRGHNNNQIKIII